MIDELEVDGVKYRAPTTPREEFERTGVGKGGRDKFNFSRKITRGQFTKKARVPKLDRANRIMKDRQTGNVLYEERVITTSVPNMDFIEKHNLSHKSEPFEWFNAFVPFKKSRQEAQCDGAFTIGDWATNTKLRASLSNAGKHGTIYTDFKDFTPVKLMKHIGVYFLQGVSPPPRVELKMKPQCMDPINGNDMVFKALGTNAERRHRHFKLFFAIQDPRIAIPS